MNQTVESAIELIRSNLAEGKYKNAHVASVARTALKRLESGLCVRCGKRPFITTSQRCQECLDIGKIDSNSRQKERKNNGICSSCNQPALEGFTRCALHRDKSNKAGVALNQRARKEAFEAYGNKCACCGMSDERFFSLDHVNNDGAAHRRELYGNREGATIALYRWAKRNGFPPLLQIHCFNCNMGKHRNGGICPHEEDRRKQQAA